MNIAVIGCGYVADFYAATARAHPSITLAGAYDIHPDRTAAFCRGFGTHAYRTFEELLADDRIELVLNLTNPRVHFETTRACLEAGKHVYSEKPLAMDPAAAVRLCAIARERGLRIGAAPCNVLGQTGQTVLRAIRDGAIGQVRLVYANYDDGLFSPRKKPWEWTSTTGAHWPAKDEFEVGCTYEHAGYLLTWLAAFFGPARRVTSFSSCTIPEKGIEVASMAPDFSVGCLEYDEGVVARLTCGMLAPADKSLLVIGDEGHLLVKELRNDTAPVFIRRAPLEGSLGLLERVAIRARRWSRGLERHLPWPGGTPRFYRRCRPVDLGRPMHRAASDKPVDFMLGVAEMAEAIRAGRPHRLSAELAIHIVELVEALQHPERRGHHRAIESDFGPIEPVTR